MLFVNKFTIWTVHFCVAVTLKTAITCYINLKAYKYEIISSITAINVLMYDLINRFLVACQTIG